ncbi:MAG TPA: hypothetical protein VJX70_04220 [Candidatus Acidoferrum sp.]|nr:hypothetical protein [Candidatus Acidoferrum sp.]
MQRSFLVFGFLATICLFAAVAPAQAQIGMDIFQRPSITKVLHPVVGKGAAYLSTDKDGKTRTTEVSVVGKDSVDGKEGFWVEFYSTDSTGKAVVGKALITLADFQFQRMIIQPPGQQAMEMPMNMANAHRSKIEENANDWHSVGPDTITVPAGTFPCEHWHNDKTNGDIWTSDKITPFGMVKDTHNGTTQVLTKILDNATDRITGPVKQFDMQQMIQQMQQQHQQRQQP